MPVMFGTVGAPSSTSAADASNQAVLQGKAGEIIKADLHGYGYTAAYRGRLFLAATAAAGVTIPISSSTSPTFTLYNPIGSGVVAELLKLNIGITNATTVVSPLLLGAISGLIVAPTSVTARSIISANLGGAGVALAQLYTAATLAAAATNFLTVGSVSATSGAFPNLNYDLNGCLLLQPGSLVHVCGTAAQTSASTISLLYAEFPL